MFVFVHLISRDIDSSSSVKQREVSVRDAYSPREEFPWCWQHWRITWSMETGSVSSGSCFSPTLSSSPLSFSVAAIQLNLPSLVSVDSDKKCCCCAGYRSEYSICNFSSICPPFPSLLLSLCPFEPLCLSSSVLCAFFPPVTCFLHSVLLCCLLCFFLAFAISFFSPIYLPYLPSSPVTCLWLPPPAYVLLFLYFSGPLPFFL